MPRMSSCVSSCVGSRYGSASCGAWWSPGDTLLYADREPNCPREWEEWFAAVRKALTRHNLAVSADQCQGEVALALLGVFI